MSFIEENVEEAAAPDYENRERWMEALEEHQDGIGVVYGRGVRTAELPREKRKKLTRGLIWLWVILFCVAVAYASVHLAAQSCKRGRDNSMWIITVVAADIVITIASLCFGVVGILIKDEIFMQQAAALHAVAAIWHTLQGLFYLFFVLLLSKIAGEWLRGGRYKQQQIADFNAFLNALIFIGVILVLLCVASSKIPPTTAAAVAAAAAAAAAVAIAVVVVCAPAAAVV